MVIKENTYLQLDSFCPNQSMYSFSSEEVTNTMDPTNNTPPQFEALTSPQSITTRHSPSLDEKSSNGYYSTESPTDTFQRSSSQSSLTGTMSPHDYTELRSPVRQETQTFFPQGQMFEQTHGFPAQSFGVFGTNSVHTIENNGGHIMNNELDIKSPLEIKPTMQTGQQYYTHDVIQQGVPGGGQMSSPNSHRGNMGTIGIPSISQFSGYRPYPQISDVYASKPEFYMQPPYFQTYPNYW